MAARHARYTVHQVLEHIFEEGSNSEGQLTEDEGEREDDEFLFDDIPNNGTETVSSVNTRPAPAQALATGIVVPAEIGIFEEDTNIDGGSDITNKDEDGNIEEDESDTPGVYDMETDVDAEGVSVS